MNFDPNVIAAAAAYVEDHHDTIVQELMELVRIPSVLGPAEDGAPFGAGAARALKHSCRLFEAYGYCAELDDSNAFGLVQVGTGAQKLGVFCHCDTVGENGGWDCTDPFDPILRDGYLIGRGVKDDKGAVIAILHALQALKAAGVTLRNRVEVFLGSNEEAGMADLHQYLQKHTKPGLSLVPDCDFIVCRGEKSGYRFVTRSRAKFNTILSFTGTNTPGVVCRSAYVTMPNTPALLAELTEALEGRSDATLTVNDKGELLLQTMGISAHSSVPMGSINGGAIAAEILLNCPSLGEHDLALLQTAYCILADYYGTFFHVAYPKGDFRPMTHIVSLIHTVDGQLEFTVYLRCDPKNKMDWVQKKVKATLELAEWDYLEGTYAEGMVKGRHHRAVQLMEEAYRAIEASPSRGIYTSAGATYARELKSAYAIGIDAPQTKIPADFKPGHGGVHQPDECLNLEAFLKGIQVQALMLLALDANLEQITEKD